MRILQISFAKVKNQSTNQNFNNKDKNKSRPIQNRLAPLLYDTVTFKGAPLPKEFPYSAAQKEREIALLLDALNEALEKSDFIDANELAKRTGLDKDIVSLRLSTNSKVRVLNNRLKVAKLIDAKNKREAEAQNIQAFFEKIKTSKQKLTDRELAFYLGLEKDSLLEFTKDFPSLSSLRKGILYKTKKYSLLERREQDKSIAYAMQYSKRKHTYEDIREKTGYTLDAIRAAFSENEDLFKSSTEHRFYPPEIYSKEEVEAQESSLMDAMLFAIKHNLQPDIKTLAKKAEMLPGVAEKRIYLNDALKETYERILGIDED